MTRQAKARSLGSIRDERGRAVSVLDPMIDWAAARYERIPRETLDSIIGAMSRGAPPNRRAIIAGLALLALLTLGAAVFIGLDVVKGGPSARADLKQGVLITAPAVVGMLIAAVVVPAVLARRRRLAAARRVLLDHGRCPHCGYDLSGLPCEGSIATCPECGCAWRLPGG